MGNYSEKIDTNLNKNKHIQAKAKSINKKDKIPDTFQLSLNINFDTENLHIHELSFNRIGILSKLNLCIYSLTTFKQIDNIKINLSNNIFFKLFDEARHYENDLKNDFLELYNYDIVVWTRNLILFYKMTNKGYEFYQKITDNYKINSIYELKNKNLITCSVVGLNIYSKKKNKYYLLEQYPLENEVLNLFEVKNYSLILIQKTNKHYDNKFILSLHDIKNEIEIKKYEQFEYNENLKFALKDKFLFVNFNKECLIFNKNNLALCLKFSGNFFGDFFGDTILIEDKENKIIKIYEFKDGKINFCKSFPFNFTNIIKLNNGNLIGIKNNQIKVINCFLQKK